MAIDEIQFNDGAAYERYMGKWSQLAGTKFLDWLAPGTGLKWLDVGCGNGAFTSLLMQRCQPAAVVGIDPSAAQLEFARQAAALKSVQFQQGDAMALDFDVNSFDAAVMPLVIFFVADPAKGVAEMARVVRPGGSVSAYSWDMLGGGFPYGTLHAELRALGVTIAAPPSPDASQVDILRALWLNAKLTEVDTTEIVVQRAFPDFNDYWATVLRGPSVGAKIAALSGADLALLRTRMERHTRPDASGRIIQQARANAVRGRVAELI
jgi:SAM-dependent methyltransferase